MLSFEFTADFRDSLRELPSDIQKRVKEKLAYLASCENPLLFARKLKTTKDIYRFRIGDYRAVFRYDQTVLIFLIVKHRKEIYQGL